MRRGAAKVSAKTLLRVRAKAVQTIVDFFF